VVSAGLIAAELKVTQRAALGLVADLGIREVTGRGRYRAWGYVCDESRKSPNAAIGCCQSEQGVPAPPETYRTNVVAVGLRP